MRRYISEHLPALLFIAAAALFVIVFTNAALATEKPSPLPEPPAQSQGQNQDQSQTQSQSQQQANNQTQSQAASSSQSQSQGNTQTIDSKYQAPSTFAVAPQATAPCYYANGWSVGVPGAGGGRSRAHKDAECWAEYVKQAEHERALDLAKLALERDRIRLETLKLEHCVECGARK